MEPQPIRYKAGSRIPLLDPLRDAGLAPEVCGAGLTVNMLHRDATSQMCYRPALSHVIPNGTAILGTGIQIATALTSDALIRLHECGRPVPHGQLTLFYGMSECLTDHAACSMRDMPAPPSPPYSGHAPRRQLGTRPAPAPSPPPGRRKHAPLPDPAPGPCLSRRLRFRRGAPAATQGGLRLTPPPRAATFTLHRLPFWPPLPPWDGRGAGLGRGHPSSDDGPRRRWPLQRQRLQ